MVHYDFSRDRSWFYMLPMCTAKLKPTYIYPTSLLHYWSLMKLYNVAYKLNCEDVGLGLWFSTIICEDHKQTVIMIMLCYERSSPRSCLLCTKSWFIISATNKGMYIYMHVINPFQGTWYKIYDKSISVNMSLIHPNDLYIAFWFSVCVISIFNL